MREGLALLVRLQPDMQLVGTAATAEQAVQMYLEQRPDMTLMDLDLPSESAIGAIRKICARDPGARIIGLTTYEPDASWCEGVSRRSVPVCRQGPSERQPPAADSNGQSGRSTPLKMGGNPRQFSGVF